MTKRTKSRTQSAKVRVLPSAAGLNLRDKVKSSDIPEEAQSRATAPWRRKKPIGSDNIQNIITVF